ncbi:MAG: PspC domain-containing protein [Acidimicrobiales bacterium]
MTDEPFPPNPDDPGRQSDPATGGSTSDDDPWAVTEPTPAVATGPDAADTDADAEAGPDWVGPPPPRPPGPAYSPTRRLVRDPNGVLGGVASGVAHVYGFDVSLVRLVFVLLAFSTGIGFLAYLAAWLIIPRATYWPPAPAPSSGPSSLRGRDGLLLAVAVTIALIGLASSGWPGSVVAAVVLVGVGVVLLNRTPAPVQVSAGQGVAVTVASAATDTADVTGTAGSGPDGTGPAGEPTGRSGGGAIPPPYDPAYAAYSQPVPPRRRGWGWIVLVIMLGAGTVIAASLVAVAGLAVRYDYRDGATIDMMPATVGELPAVIDEDRGMVTVDLRDLDGEDLLVDGRPRSLDINLRAGEVDVIVPDDIEVTVNADSSVGAIDVFDEIDDGLDNRVVYSDPGPIELRLNIDVGAGDIEVLRG